MLEEFVLLCVENFKLEIIRIAPGGTRDFVLKDGLLVSLKTDANPTPSGEQTHYGYRELFWCHPAPRGLWHIISAPCLRWNQTRKSHWSKKGERLSFPFPFSKCYGKGIVGCRPRNNALIWEPAVLPSAFCLCHSVVVFYVQRHCVVAVFILALFSVLSKQRFVFRVELGATAAQSVQELLHGVRLQICIDSIASLLEYRIFRV